MSTTSQVTALAQRVAGEFVTIREEIAAVPLYSWPFQVYSGGAWPSRVSSVPAGYTGYVLQISTDPAAPEPPDGIDGDIWLRRVS